MVALVDQAHEIVFSRMMWDSRHGDAIAFCHVAGGEHDVQLLGGDFRVVVKRLVEVSQAEE